MRTCEQCQSRFTKSTATAPDFCSTYCERQRHKADSGLSSSDSKVCHCGTVYYRAPGTSRKRFADRKGCSISCTTAERHRRKAKEESAKPKESKVCHCGTRFYRKPGVKPSSFARRRVCSKVCVGTAPKSLGPDIVETKSCEYCSATYDRRKSETRERFSRRIACSRSCAGYLRAAQAAEEREIEDEDLLSQVQGSTPEAESLRYYLNHRRERMKAQWERELWQAML